MRRSKAKAVAETPRCGVPRHVKIDTETLAQILVPYKEAVLARKDGPITRTGRGARCWDRNKVDRKGFHFHHEVTTDGVSVSVLYNTPDPSL